MIGKRRGLVCVCYGECDALISCVCVILYFVCAKKKIAYRSGRTKPGTICGLPSKGVPATGTLTMSRASFKPKKLTQEACAKQTVSVCDAPSLGIVKLAALA